MKKVKISFLIGLLALGAQAAFNDEDLEALRARVRGLEKKAPKRMGEDFARQEGNEKINATLGINLVMGLNEGDASARFMSAAQAYFEAVGGGMFARANAHERARADENGHSYERMRREQAAREEADRREHEWAQAEENRRERERQERMRREQEEWAETQRKAREAREKADREAREKAEADRVERERQERMRREQAAREEADRKARAEEARRREEAQERLRREREEADRKEEARRADEARRAEEARKAREARDARAQAEADAAERAEEARRQQEAAARRARQQREDEEKKAELEKQRREAEKEKERRKAEREARERAEADGKAREARERADREARERAEAEDKAREAREKAAREAREQEEATRKAREAREKSEREAREEAEKSRKAAEEKARREEEERRVKAQRIRVLENSTARRATQIKSDQALFVSEKERGDAAIKSAVARVEKASIDVHSGDQTDARARLMSVEALRDEAYRMLDTEENTHLSAQVRRLESLLGSLRLQSEELTQLAALTKMSMEEMAQRRQALENLQQDLRQTRRTFADIVPNTWEYKQASEAYSALELQSKALGEQFNQAVRDIALHEDDPHDGVRPFIQKRDRISAQMDALSGRLNRAKEDVQRAKLRFPAARDAQDRINALERECDRVKQDNEAAKHQAQENVTQNTAQIEALEKDLAKARAALANNGRVRAEGRAKDDELLSTSPPNAFKIIVSIPGKGMIGKFLQPQEVGGLQREYVLVPDDKAPKNGARFVFIATGLKTQNGLVSRDLKALFGQRGDAFNFGSLPGFDAALKEQFVSTTSVQE